VSGRRYYVIGRDADGGFEWISPSLSWAVAYTTTPLLKSAKTFRNIEAAVTFRDTFLTKDWHVLNVRIEETA